MIEKIVFDYLAANLAYPVYMERPEDPEATCVVIEKTGSARENHVESAVFAVQSYAPSLYEAACLNETVKSVMDDLITVPEVSAVRLNSDYNFTDTTKKAYRYQAIYNIFYL